MISFFNGVGYNLKGLKLGLSTPRLLWLGLLRLLIATVLTLVAVGLVLAYHETFLAWIWTQPDNVWLLWLWYLVSWLVALLLVAIASVGAYLVSQILFCAVLMDLMSRLTEQLVTGQPLTTSNQPFWQHVFYLMRQEIPRAVVPVIVSLLLLVGGWLTPLGPLIALVSSAAAIIFLAWDNTDIIPARQLIPFKDRWQFLVHNLPLHLGFGLWFLIPLANILFLSFAPVGAALYHIDVQREKTSGR